MASSRDMFSGIAPGSVGDTWSSVQYQSGAGQLPGAGGDGFQASVLFMPQYPGSAQHVFGNLDAAAFTGWQIGCNGTVEAETITAKIGNGAAVITATFAVPRRYTRRWFYVMLGGSEGTLALFVNGTLVDSVALEEPPVPGAGICYVGSLAAFADPFTGIIAGMTYADGVGPFGVDPFAHAVAVARTGQVGCESADTPNPTFPDNAWQAQSYNQEGSAIWLPRYGAVNLTRVGATDVLEGKNAPANAWF